MRGSGIFEAVQQLDFGKVAASPVDEDAQHWPRQILLELYKACPETSNFTPEVMLQKTDEELGYAVGVVTITNSTDSALRASRGSMPAPNHTPRVFIPVVIKGHKLMALDTIMTGSAKFLPLTAARLREALFRPETFDTMTTDVGDTSIYNTFYPPGRTDNAFGSGATGGSTVVFGNGMKTGGYQLLEELSPSLFAPDITATTALITPELEKAAAQNPVFCGGLSVIAAAEKTARQSVPELDAVLGMGEPDVIQMQYLPASNNYSVKSASRSNFWFTEREMDRGEFLKVAGPHAARRVDTDGEITIAKSASHQGIDHSGWKVVETPGLYTVKSLGGQELTGNVITGLRDFDGSVSPISIFASGSTVTVQDQVIGKPASGAPAGELCGAPASAAHGYGFFYTMGHTGLLATVPMTVQGSEAAMTGGTQFHVDSFTGEPGTVELLNQASNIVAIDGTLIVPTTAKWCQIPEGTGMPTLASDSSKTSAELLEPVAYLWGDGEVFHLSCKNMPKIAAATQGDLSSSDAVFALCLSGLSADQAYAKVADASGDSITVHGVRDVSVLPRMKVAAEKISAAVRGLRRNLIKEASVLNSTQTVDAVLSVGFINSDNVLHFVDRLPYIEQAMSMVGELLFAARLGLDSVPEAAAARAFRSLDEVAQGLRGLAVREPASADEEMN